MSSTLMDVGGDGPREADGEALIGDAAAGRDQGRAGLYDLYGRRAYALALRILRDETLAEDAVQETFLTVWSSAASYRPSAVPPARGPDDPAPPRRRLVRRQQRRRADRVEQVEEPTAT